LDFEGAGSMSNEREGAVWKDSAAIGTDLIVMLALAEHASTDGYCWPGRERLAQQARCSVRTVDRIIQRCEGLGELYVERGGGQRITNKYLVLVGLSEDEIAKALKSRFRKAPAQIEAILKAVRAGRAIGEARRKARNGDTDDTNGDTVTPFENSDIDETATLMTQTATSVQANGDIAVSPEPSVEPLKNRQRRRIHRIQIPKRPAPQQSERPAAAASGNSRTELELLRALRALNSQLPSGNRYTGEAALARQMAARGVTVDEMRAAWARCAENARSPGGAFLMWMQSGYEVQKQRDDEDNIRTNPDTGQRERWVPGTGWCPMGGPSSRGA
jgi:DNA-binding transcriptional regulator YhcF (GntR family)